MTGPVQPPLVQSTACLASTLEDSLAGPHEQRHARAGERCRAIA